jgi:hypothetical protein
MKKVSTHRGMRTINSLPLRLPLDGANQFPESETFGRDLI